MYLLNFKASTTLLPSKVTRTIFFRCLGFNIFLYNTLYGGLQTPVHDFLKRSLNSYMRLFKALFNLKHNDNCELIYQHFIFSKGVEMSPFWGSLPLIELKVSLCH